MKNGFSFVAAIITLALAGGAATATGCGGVSTTALCENICACQGCTSNDLETCQNQGDSAADQADAVGCSNQFEDLVTCTSARVSCDQGRIVIDGCELERTALTTCSSTISVPGKNACEQAADVVTARIIACGGTVTSSSSSGGTTVECTAELGAQTTCQATCIAAADCSLLVPDMDKPPTSEQSQSFVDCFTKCN